MPNTPKKHLDFSVLIPTYNRKKFLKQAILSALCQKNVSMEIIVSDDGSNDGTELVVKSFRDKRIKYIRNKEQLGTSLNFQQCFLRAKGNYIFTLGDDDFILKKDTLSKILTIMKKYSLGMAKIGTISYEDNPREPYQMHTLGERLITLKPGEQSLVDAIFFGLGYYSGLTFNNNFMDRDKLKFDHVCSRYHMCFVYFPPAYDLILRHGIAYIPNHFIVARLSLQLIPKYFRIREDGRFFMEEPITIARRFLSKTFHQQFEKKYVRAQLALLPNIKYFSGNSNYLRVLIRLIRLDKTLLAYPSFFLFGLLGFLPKIAITYLRIIVVFFSKKRIKKMAASDNYFPALEQFEKLKAHYDSNK